MTDIKRHWETIYASKQPHEVSWTQDIPQTSLDFIQQPAVMAMERIQVHDSSIRLSNRYIPEENDEYREETLSVLKAIRDKDVGFEIHNEIKGDDLYLLIQRMEKRYGRIQ